MSSTSTANEFEWCVFRDVDEEESIVRVIAKLYNHKVMYVPPRILGEPIPKAFKEFYYKSLEGLREKLIKEELSKVPASRSSSISRERKSRMLSRPIRYISSKALYSL